MTDKHQHKINTSLPDVNGSFSPLKTNTHELIEKQHSEYSPREFKLIRRLFPELKQVSDGVISQQLRTENGQISVLELKILKEFSLIKDINDAAVLLSDPERLASSMRHLTYEDSRYHRASLWALCSILPLSNDVHLYLSDRLPNQLPKRHSVSVSDVIASHLDVPSVQRQTLPFGSLPDIRTYFESRRCNSVIEVPTAIVTVEQPGEPTREIHLSSKDSALALYIMSNVLRHSPKPAIYYERGIKYQIRPKLLRILENYSEELAKNNLHKSTFSIRFTQYRKGIPKDFREFLESKETLENFLDQITDKKVIVDISRGISESTAAARRISLSSADDFLRPENIKTSEIETISGNNKSNCGGHVTKEMNELQRAHLDIARATKSGDWEKAVKLYLKYLDEWPQYLEHRMGVLDVFSRVQSGELPFHPQHIVSLASGPHEELRAYFDLSGRLAGLAMPIVISVDNCELMIEESSKTLPPGAEVYSRNIVASAHSAPLPKKIFDMIECSSFDSFRTKEETASVVAFAASLLRKGGILRFLPNDSFSEAFLNVLTENGFRIIARNSELFFTDQARNEIKDAAGKDLLKRIDRKLSRHGYFLATLTEDSDSEKIKVSLMALPALYANRSTPRSVDLSEPESGEAVSSNHDFNVCLAIVLNPEHFLNNVKISSAHFITSIQYLSGKIDTQIGREIYRTYLKSKTFPELEEAAFITCLSCRDLSKFLEFDILMHPNEAIRKAALSYILNEKHRYIKEAVNADWLDKEVRKEILLSAGTDELSSLLSSKLKTMLKDPGEKQNILNLLTALPDNSDLHLPVALRKHPEFVDEYFRICKKISREKISKEEVENLFKTFRSYRNGTTMVFRSFGTEDQNEDRMSSLSDAVDIAISGSNQELAVNILGFICYTAEKNPEVRFKTSVLKKWPDLYAVGKTGMCFESRLSAIDISESVLGIAPGNNHRRDLAKDVLSLRFKKHHNQLSVDFAEYYKSTQNNVTYFSNHFRITSQEYFEIEAEVLREMIAQLDTSIVTSIAKVRLTDVLNNFDMIPRDAQKTILRQFYSEIEEPVFFIELAELYTDIEFMIDLGRKDFAIVAPYLDRFTEKQVANLLHLRSTGIPVEDLQACSNNFPVFKEVISSAIRFSILEELLKGDTSHKQYFMENGLNEFKVERLEFQKNTGCIIWVSGVFGGKVGTRTFPSINSNYLKFKNTNPAELSVRIHLSRAGNVQGDIFKSKGSTS